MAPVGCSQGTTAFPQLPMPFFPRERERREHARRELLEAAQPQYSQFLELIYSAAPYILHKWMLLSTET